MAELENLLLQAAGRTVTPSRKNQSHVHSRWRQQGSGSGSKDDDSDNPNFNETRHSASRPLNNKLIRNRLQRNKMRNWFNGKLNRFSGDESDSAPSVGTDSYRDEADKEVLSELSELNRRFISGTRRRNIDEYRLKKRTTEPEKSIEANTPPSHSHGRSSVRTEKPDAKFDALNHLRAKRMRQQEPPVPRRRLTDSAGAASSFSRLNDFIPHPELDSSGSEDRKEDRSPDLTDNLDDLFSYKSRPISYEDAKEITIRRSKLAKWFMEPFFEAIVVGCFVRVGIGRTRNGPKYRLCVVKNVDSTDLTRQYKLEGRTTCKWLNCAWGGDASAARWQMAMVSDSLPTEEEFDDWFVEMERNGEHIPCLQDVDDKREEIQKAHTFVYSADTVKEMLKQKKSSSSRPLNVAVEKAVLKKEIAAAQSCGEKTEVERLRAKLIEMEDLSRRVKPADARALRLMEMNRKNRAENYKNASEAKPAGAGLKAGEKGYDPFSRRWTRPALLDSTAMDGEDGNGEAGEAGEAEAMEKAEAEGRLIDTRPPVDYSAELCSLHDFELPISLESLKKISGDRDVRHGLMERKRRIEAEMGRRVPDDYGRRHVLTLSISDYKRRRGLL